MRYKEKYLELQAYHFNKMIAIKKGYSDILKITSCIDTHLEGHKNELSPELYDIIEKRISEIRQICRQDNVYIENKAGCSTNIRKETSL